jgi:hypothetical protein
MTQATNQAINIVPSPFPICVLHLLSIISRNCPRVILHQETRVSETVRPSHHPHLLYTMWKPVIRDTALDVNEEGCGLCGSTRCVSDTFFEREHLQAPCWVEAERWVVVRDRDGIEEPEWGLVVNRVLLCVAAFGVDYDVGIAGGGRTE